MQTIIIEGVSEEQIKKDIQENVEGFHLFFYPPEGMNYTFINPFWGKKWENYSSEQLKKIVHSTAKIENHLKPFIMVFKYNGEDRFAYCSWTNQLYDFQTKRYFDMKDKEHISSKLSALIQDIMDDWGFDTHKNS